MKRTHLSLAVGLAMGAAFAVPAWAQPQSADTSQTSTDKQGSAPAKVKQLDQIVVTARMRKETLQDVPVAVTAFTPETLDMLNI